MPNQTTSFGDAGVQSPNFVGIETKHKMINGKTFLTLHPEAVMRFRNGFLLAIGG